MSAETQFQTRFLIQNKNSILATSTQFDDVILSQKEGIGPKSLLKLWADLWWIHHNSCFCCCFLTIRWLISIDSKFQCEHKSAFGAYTFLLTQNHIIKLRRSSPNRVFILKTTLLKTILCFLLLQSFKFCPFIMMRERSERIFP